uniref:Uncharacterized protein n=1 Tax=Rhizophora mucronata TaxID=61149 RepID=A0A2P2LIT4_RHIMU
MPVIARASHLKIMLGCAATTHTFTWYRRRLTRDLLWDKWCSTFLRLIQTATLTRSKRKGWPPALRLDRQR